MRRGLPSRLVGLRPHGCQPGGRHLAVCHQRLLQLAVALLCQRKRLLPPLLVARHEPLLQRVDC